MPRPRCLLCFSVALLAAAPALAQPAGSTEALDGAEGRPRWEVGMMAGGGRVADYPGANQSHTRGLIAPVFIYRGPVLRVDEGAIRGRFINSPDWELDLSATAAFNARDNDARRGMPGLDYMFGVGPQLVFKGLRGTLGGPSIHLKSRVLFSTDFKHVDRRGVSFDPEVRWSMKPWRGSNTTLTLSVEPTWASRALHAYFYEVAPAYADLARPAYRARSGYLGTDFGVSLNGRAGPTLGWFVGGQVLSLHGAANAASPLLRDKINLSLGAGFIWTPWQSSERVQ